jgi:hypothetical protein
MSQSIANAMEVLAAEHEALYGLAEAARDVIEVWGS